MERATEGDEQLTETLMGVSSPTLASRHIIDPINPFDVERHHQLSLGKRQVATRVGNFGQVDNLNIHRR